MRCFTRFATLHTATTDEHADSGETTGLWPFNDRPRSLRLRAIDHVPELIEALANEVVRTAKRVAEKANTVDPGTMWCWGVEYDHDGLKVFDAQRQLLLDEKWTVTGRR